MKAVIESRDGAYLIRFYQDDYPIDAYAVESITLDMAGILTPLPSRKNSEEEEEYE